MEECAGVYPAQDEGCDMSSGAKLALGLGAGFVFLWIVFSFWWALLILVGLPVAGYLMLDQSQRRKLRGLGRKELGN